MHFHLVSIVLKSRVTSKKICFVLCIILASVFIFFCFFNALLLDEIVLESSIATDAPSKSYEYGVCIVTRVKNAAYLLPQWIEYHLVAGVDHFWIADDCSNDGGKTLFWAKFYEKSGHASVFQPYKNCTDHKPNENHLLGMLFEKAKTRCEWIAVIDADEYIFLIHDTIPNIDAKGLENSIFGNIKIFLNSTSRIIFRLPWYIMSTHHREERPDSLIIQAYVNGRFEKRPHIKTIMKSKFVTEWDKSHFPSSFAQSIGSHAMRKRFQKFASHPYMRHYEMVQIESSSAQHKWKWIWRRSACLKPKSNIFIKHFMHLAWKDFLEIRGERELDSTGHKNVWKGSEIDMRRGWENANLTMNCPLLVPSVYSEMMSVRMLASIRKKLGKFHGERGNTQLPKQQDQDVYNWINGNVLSLE